MCTEPQNGQEMKRMAFLSLLLLPMLLSCHREDPVITFDKDRITLEEGGGSMTVSLTTNYAWTAAASDPWIHVSPEKGEKGTASLTIRADASDRSTLRRGSVSVTSRDLVRSVTVEQLPMLDQTLVIRHGNDVFTLPSLAGSSVSGTVDWGDGKKETWSRNLKHSYDVSGNHTVEIRSSGAYSFQLGSVAGVTEVDFRDF